MKKQKIPDSHRVWLDTVAQARTIALSKLAIGSYIKNFNVPSLIADILSNFHDIQLYQDFFWHKGKMVTNDEAIENLDHFFSYYLLDDGEVDITGDTLRIAMDDSHCSPKLKVAEFIIEKLK